jgi:hypothetical protein
MPQLRHLQLFRQPRDAVQHLLPDRQDLALEGFLVGDVGAGDDDRLRDPRHRLDDRLAEPRRVDADVAPCEHVLPFGADEVLDVADRDVARFFLHRQKAHRHGIAAGRRQFDAAAEGPITQ